MIKLKVKQLPHAEGFYRYSLYQTDWAAGLDLRAALLPKDYGPGSLPPGTRMLVPTGLVMAIPKGYEGQIRPRSGLALKHGVTVLNTPGTIDADYRGEIKVILINHHPTDTFTLNLGDRIAQLVIAPVTKVTIEMVDELEDTERGEGGFGSTGVS